MTPQTVFILINRSFLIRNILRSGTLAGLKAQGYTIHVFFDAKNVPAYLKEEFEDATVHLHGTKIIRRGLHRWFNKLKIYFVVTYNTKLYFYYYGKSVVKKILPSGIISRTRKNPLVTYAEVACAEILSRLGFVKWLFRWIERDFFPQHDGRIKHAFDTLKPDLIFSTSIGGTFESVFLKEASRRNIPTVSMMKSWDNISNQYLPVLPDYFLAQNEITARYARELQGMAAERIQIVGIPQFDWYRREGVIVSREEHLARKGFDPARELIFFGSEGTWSINDYRVAEQIYEWIARDELVRPCQLLVRPHYSDIDNPALAYFEGKQHVVIDRYRKVDFLIEKWDPNETEIRDFTNSVAHAAVMINIASTLSLDAACMDRPIVNVAFGCEYTEGVDVTSPKLYGTDHIRWLMEPGGGEKVHSFTELKAALNAYLLDPGIRKEGRARLREELCYKVDGNASTRVVEALNKILRQGQTHPSPHA